MIWTFFMRMLSGLLLLGGDARDDFFQPNSVAPLCGVDWLLVG